MSNHKCKAKKIQITKDNNQNKSDNTPKTDKQGTRIQGIILRPGENNRFCFQGKRTATE